MQSLAKVAIIGRPNVGKSTLFNRLIGRKEAIVYEQPGVTRDRHYGLVEFVGHQFEIIDTGGFDPDLSDTLNEQMQKQLELAIKEAHFIWLLVDAAYGLHPLEKDLFKKIRKLKKPFSLVVNKVDHPNHIGQGSDFYSLGAKNYFEISAEHGRNIGDFLEDFIQSEDFQNYLIEHPTKTKKKIIKKEVLEDSGEETEEIAERMLKVCLVGRPNVGKSSLLNRLYGAPRAIVHDKPGTTRDSMNIKIEHGDKEYEFIDTAGIRKKSHSEGLLEKVAIVKSRMRIEKSGMVLLLIDASEKMTAQDARIAEMALERKKPLLILANKWDKVESEWVAFVKDIRVRYKNFEFVPVHAISAKTGLGIDRIFEEIEQIQKEYQKRIKTAKLNECLEMMLQKNPPPLASGKNLHLFYMTQTRVRPPHFVIIANHPSLIPESYRRYLTNQIRDVFGFRACPIVIEFQRKKKKRFHG